jgi:hypothetical protein
MITGTRALLVSCVFMVLVLCGTLAQAAGRIPRPAAVKASAKIRTVSADFDRDKKQETMAFSVTGEDGDFNDEGILWFVNDGKIVQQWSHLALADMFVASFTGDGKPQFIYTTQTVGSGQFWELIMLQYRGGNMTKFWTAGGSTRSGRDYLIVKGNKKSLLVHISAMNEDIGYGTRKSQFEAITYEWKGKDFKATGNTKRTSAMFETTDEAKKSLGIKGLALHPSR